jgi:hypothetical protein
VFGEVLLVLMVRPRPRGEANFEGLDACDGDDGATGREASTTVVIFILLRLCVAVYCCYELVSTVGA